MLGISQTVCLSDQRLAVVGDQDSAAKVAIYGRGFEIPG